MRDFESRPSPFPPRSNRARERGRGQGQLRCETVGVRISGGSGSRVDRAVETISARARYVDLRFAFARGTDTARLAEGVSSVRGAGTGKSTERQIVCGGRESCKPSGHALFVGGIAVAKVAPGIPGGGSGLFLRKRAANLACGSGCECVAVWPPNPCQAEFRALSALA